MTPPTARTSQSNASETAIKIFGGCVAGLVIASISIYFGLVRDVMTKSEIKALINESSPWNRDRERIITMVERNVDVIDRMTINSVSQTERLARIEAKIDDIIRRIDNVEKK